ncbi:MAG: hypothetical protein JWO32_2590 [Bacteroidetes bacterium]|nr:hypothetical protein [Bacteroidota bacterium]
MKRFILCLAALPLFVSGQFAPAAGQPGTSAIKKDSSIIINWAVGCKIIRGLQDISNLSGGYATVGDSSSAIGPADGVNVVSLGDGGSAVLSFQSPITNLQGTDFCVFENSFDPGFLELAFVEVSSDGINFTRFPATSNIQITLQIGPFDTNSDPAKINNLAGKYIGGYGCPFDLQELAGISGLNINAISHVKLIDVVGCVQSQYASFDQNNNKINDPWSTPFPSGGFDLDAVGVMHQLPLSLSEKNKFESSLKIFPSVTDDVIIIINCNEKNISSSLMNVSGKIVFSKNFSGNRESLSLKELPEGVYFLSLRECDNTLTKKIIRIN